MLPPNASPLEVTWSSLASGGFVFAFALCCSIYRSLVAVQAWIAEGRAVRWGPRHKFVVGFLLGIALLTLVWAGFVALGVNAMVNPPPLSPDREEAAARGGWILTGLEALLFLFQVVLLWAWKAVGGPSLHPNPVAKVSDQ